MPSKTSQKKREKPPILLVAAAVGTLLFLHIPLAIIMVYAFTTDEASFTFPLPGLTTRWFAVAANRPDLWAAVQLSVKVAVIATLSALLLGSLAAAAVHRSKFFGRDSISFLLVLPLALPGIVSGIALRSAIGMLAIPFSFWTIVIGHATFCIVVVYNNVLARLRRTAGSLVEASMDLGANSWQTFIHVVLPNIATALLAGGAGVDYALAQEYPEARKMLAVGAAESLASGAKYRVHLAVKCRVF